MKEIWILEASQGQWSDRCDWIVGVYDSEKALLQGMPVLKKVTYNDFNIGREIVCYGAVEEEEGTDTIYYRASLYDVMGYVEPN